jgi:hypothetical protein
MSEYLCSVIKVNWVIDTCSLKYYRSCVVSVEPLSQNSPDVAQNQEDH